MTKRIPKVGDVYKCLDGSCRVARTGELVRITYVNTGYTTADYTTINSGCEGGWSFAGWPNDFKLVQESAIDQANTSTIDVKPPVDGGKPPLGLQPWNVHDNLRIQDILAAMQRYVAANKAVPNEWLEELIDKIELDYTKEGIYHE